MEELFVYGTLKLPKAQKGTIGRIISGEPERLFGYELKEIQICDESYPAEDRNENSGKPVCGLVLSLTPGELLRLDEYETTAYRRERVVLASGKEAWAYVKA